MRPTDDAAPRPGRRADRLIWIAVGYAALAIGAVGVVVPLLPTAPLVILAAFAFGKGSPRLQATLEQSRLFGPIIADWKATGAIAPRYKALAVSMMAVTLTGSIIAGLAPFILVIQAVCLGAAAIFVLSRPNE